MTTLREGPWSMATDSEGRAVLTHRRLAITIAFASEDAAREAMASGLYDEVAARVREIEERHAA